MNRVLISFYGYDITLLNGVLALALLLVLLYQVYFYVRYIGAVHRLNRRRTGQETVSPLPGVSVIVSAQNEGINLRPYLQTLLEQDYPCYEVIVVDDGSEDDTRLVLDDYQQHYPHLKRTFVPLNARIRSSKKLALTLAIKAAQYEHLLFTDADCCPQSNQWIKSMVSGFTESRNGGENTEFVLGYGAYFPSREHVARIIGYDTLFNGLHFLGRAIAGHPYMGVGRNMMYRKSTFILHNGFAGFLNLKCGDDDLFVNRWANRKNTNVVCTPQSQTWSIPKTTYRDWLLQKRRHLCASSYYRPATRTMVGFEPFMRGLWYALLIVTGVMVGCYGAPLWLAAWALLLMTVRLSLRWAIIDRAARQLGTDTFGARIIVYDIFLPLLTLFLLATQRKDQCNHW